jgi:hypothetical protein
MAYFLRTNGLLLFFALAVCLLDAFWPDWLCALKKAIAPLLVFFALLVLQVALLPGGQESYFSHFSMFTLQGFWENILFYAWLPARSFDGLPLGAVLYPLLLVFLVFNLFSHWRRDAPLLAYSLLSLLLFIGWPERQGLRFIYPVLPVLFIGAWDGMLVAVGRLKARRQRTARFAVHGLGGFLLVVCLFASVNMAYLNMLNGREINGPFDQYSKQMYAFIREQTPADSVFIFMRPRALRLFTGRDTFMTENCVDLAKGDYVAISQKNADNGQIPPEQVVTCNDKLNLEEVFTNKRFAIFKIGK